MWDTSLFAAPGWTTVLPWMLRERVDTLERENAELKGRTDVAIAIERSMTAHEERAQARHEASLGILALIAERLGPDRNGGK